MGGVERWARRAGCLAEWQRWDEGAMCSATHEAEALHGGATRSAQEPKPGQAHTQGRSSFQVVDTESWLVNAEIDWFLIASAISSRPVFAEAVKCGTGEGLPLTR